VPLSTLPASAPTASTTPFGPTTTGDNDDIASQLDKHGINAVSQQKRSRDVATPGSMDTERQALNVI
jgi:hypothetical protein